MKKLHFRRFFRPTTTTRGGSTAGPPPEHHHMGRRFSCTSCTHVWHSSHTHSATHMSTHPYSPPPHLTFLFFSLHSPLPTHSTRNPKWTLGGSPDIPSHHSFTHLRLGRNPRRSIQFSLGKACRNIPRRPIRPDASPIRPDVGYVCPFCSSIFTTFHFESHFHPFTKYLPHIPNTTTIHFPPPFHRSIFTISCHSSRGARIGS